MKILLSITFDIKLNLSMVIITSLSFSLGNIYKPKIDVILHKFYPLIQCISEPLASKYMFKPNNNNLFNPTLSLNIWIIGGI